MNYISVKAASEKMGHIGKTDTKIYVRKIALTELKKFGRAWMIPKDAEKPVDGRMKNKEQTGGESWNLMKSYNSLGLERT